MKKLIIAIALSAILTGVSAESAEKTKASTRGTPIFDYFVEVEKKHREEAETEGLAYMLGGGTGLVTSLSLGISSKEVFPKLGYGLIQVLSASAIAHGAILYYNGDDFSREVQKLKDLQESLDRTSVAGDQKSQVLEESAKQAYRRAKAFRIKSTKIRGAMELTTAASAVATLAFSPVKGSASNLTLGFIALLSAIAGTADLIELGRTDSKMNLLETFQAGITPGLHGPALAMTYRW